MSAAAYPTLLPAATGSDALQTSTSKDFEQMPDEEDQTAEEVDEGDEGRAEEDEAEEDEAEEEDEDPMDAASAAMRIYAKTKAKAKAKTKSKAKSQSVAGSLGRAAVSAAGREGAALAIGALAEGAGAVGVLEVAVVAAPAALAAGGVLLAYKMWQSSGTSVRKVSIAENDCIKANLVRPLSGVWKPYNAEKWYKSASGKHRQCTEKARMVFQTALKPMQAHDSHVEAADTVPAIGTGFVGTDEIKSLHAKPCELKPGEKSTGGRSYEVYAFFQVTGKTKPVPALGDLQIQADGTCKITYANFEGRVEFWRREDQFGFLKGDWVPARPQSWSVPKNSIGAKMKWDPHGTASGQVGDGIRDGILASPSPSARFNSFSIEFSTIEGDSGKPVSGTVTVLTDGTYQLNYTVRGFGSTSHTEFWVNEAARSVLLEPFKGKWVPAKKESWLKKGKGWLGSSGKDESAEDANTVITFDGDGNGKGKTTGDISIKLDLSGQLNEYSLTVNFEGAEHSGSLFMEENDVCKMELPELGRTWYWCKSSKAASTARKS